MDSSGIATIAAVVLADASPAQRRHQRGAQAIPLLEQFSDVATADVARRHLLQLQRFGRYPHRNAALGRVSSPEEVVLMQQSQR